MGHPLREEKKGRLHLTTDIDIANSVFIIKRTGQVASVLQTVLPIYFDFRISVGNPLRIFFSPMRHSRVGCTAPYLTELKTASLDSSNKGRIQG